MVLSSSQLSGSAKIFRPESRPVTPVSASPPTLKAIPCSWSEFTFASQHLPPTNRLTSLHHNLGPQSHPSPSWWGHANSGKSPAGSQGWNIVMALYWIQKSYCFKHLKGACCLILIILLRRFSRNGVHKHWRWTNSTLNISCLCPALPMIAILIVIHCIILVTFKVA